MVKLLSCYKQCWLVIQILIIFITELLVNFIYSKESITCRDATQKRIERLERMIKSYIPKEDMNKLINIEFNDKSDIKNNQFDKVCLILLSI